MFPTTQPGVLELAKKRNFEQFSCLYRPAIIVWCHSQGLQHADGEDLAQVILVKLWNALPHFDYDPGKRFRSWLVTVLRHALTDYFRDRARQPKLQEVGDKIMQEIEDSAVVALMSTISPEPTTDEWKSICRVKEQVEATTWECFELREVQGWPIDEIAKATGKKSGAVHQALYRVWKLLDPDKKLPGRQKKS